MAQKKVRDQPVMQRRSWISRDEALSLSRQCRLAGVTRSVMYAESVATVDVLELTLLRLLDEEYTRHPFYGSRKMVVWLGLQGYVVNRKRVQRLMRTLGLAGMAPGPNTSKPHPEHKVFPYLLRGVQVGLPNQVWSFDITYVRLARGFVYLVAIIDWYSRKVLAWQVSNTMDTGFCLDCLNAALHDYGAPGIFNTDQGSQFTSAAWIKLLQEHGVQISMDGRGRALDNIFVERLWRSVKYEDIYLKGYADVPELLLGLGAYFAFYNTERTHQSLGYKTPDQVYAAGSGGGARIPDRFGQKKDSSEKEMGQRQSAAMVVEPS
jgi:putative transposase